MYSESEWRRAPDEHARLGRGPLRESAEVAPHRALEHVALRVVELRDVLCVRAEALEAPCMQHPQREDLCQ